ncbi:MAG: helix-turn-helix domain-containing protein [Acetatifactor sp.]|nr:helix-turn-helix domain-containing protein [Acetatifactor sp.]
MQVNIGEKIKELRKRDGRRQEDLANALGITAQAVSRWEAGTCYPDVGLIPAIANYFHVSIDALFGYQNDREGKIDAYAQEALRRMINGKDSGETIQFLRKCLEEFPGEPKLLKHLASALQSKGFQEADPRNPYLEEAAAIYEELSIQDPEVVNSLLFVYARMGELEKAENKAGSQPRVELSKEVLLATLPDLAKAEQYRGEAILSLLHPLERITENAVLWNNELKNTRQGIEIMEALYDLYEKIFDGKNYGIFHSDLFMLSLFSAKTSAKMKEYDQSLTFFERACVHYKEYWRIMEISMQGIPQEPHYESPLLSEAKGILAGFAVCKPEYLKDVITSYPAKLKKQIMKDPKYAELFEEKKETL